MAGLRKEVVLEDGEVELPVCPRCGRITKHPGQKALGFQCVGPLDAQHKKTKMVMRRFRMIGPELVPEEA